MLLSIEESSMVTVELLRQAPPAPAAAVLPLIVELAISTLAETLPVQKPPPAVVAVLLDSIQLVIVAVP